MPAFGAEVFLCIYVMSSRVMCCEHPVAKVWHACIQSQISFRVMKQLNMCSGFKHGLGCPCSQQCASHSNDKTHGVYGLRRLLPVCLLDIFWGPMRAHGNAIDVGIALQVEANARLAEMRKERDLFKALNDSVMANQAAFKEKLTAAEASAQTSQARVTDLEEQVGHGHHSAKPSVFARSTVNRK